MQVKGTGNVICETTALMVWEQAKELFLRMPFVYIASAYPKSHQIPNLVKVPKLTNSSHDFGYFRRFYRLVLRWNKQQENTNKSVFFFFVSGCAFHPWNAFVFMPKKSRLQDFPMVNPIPVNLDMLGNLSAEGSRWNLKGGLGQCFRYWLTPPLKLTRPLKNWMGPNPNGPP